MKWKIPKGPEDWHYLNDAGETVDVLHYDNGRMSYFNQAGDPLGKEFNAAKRAIETGAVPKSGPKQEKLIL